MELIDIKSLDEEELLLEITNLNEPKFRATQIFKWLHKGITSFDEMSDISNTLKAKLKEKYEIKNVYIKEKYVSNIDGTVKFLYELKNKKLIESVVMQYKYGYSICISTQVGCRMGCSFCASGVYGLEQNLTASEMLSEITTAQNELGIRISNIVLMGMGEPLDNFENTIKFLKLVSNNNGLNIGFRHISLSTCGIVPKILELSTYNFPITLSVSLHAPNNKIRNEIMKINKKYNVEELILACKKYFNKTNRRISFEYAIINGINDNIVNAKELYNLLKGLPCHINLIPANPIKDSIYKTPNIKNVKKFQNALLALGMNATVRRTLGADISASCGQLRNKNKR